MAVNVGSASVTIMPTMSGFAAKMDRELGGAGKSGGAAFSKEFGGAARPGGGFLGKFRSAGTQAGSSMGESVGKGISAKGAAIAGALGGLASTIGAKLIGAVQGLMGEIADASDSAQKFASTLSFADLDDSTIRQLTASTQAYADETVYDLSDIRNTTAQLAANGVDNYAQLAEAAGNLNAVAGGNADTFKSVGMVMTQTAGAGKLTTENWNQLSDAIPGASGKLQEALRANGAYTGNFREAMEKGEISAEEFNRAIMDLGMTDAAKEAATSTATIEGAMGNLEAAGVKAGMVLLDAFKPLITGGINGATDAITAVTDGVSVFIDSCAQNGAAQTLSDTIGQLGTAAGNVGGALGGLALSLLGVEPSGDAAKDAADGLKNALDAAKPVVKGVSDATGWLKDHASEAAPYVKGLAVAFAAFRVAKGIAGFVSAFSVAVGGMAVASPAAAAGTTALAGGETAAGTAAGVSAGQMLAFGAAVLMVGAGVLLASAGLLVLANAAVMIASSGPAAAIAMAAMVGTVALLAVGAAALAPALTAGAVGMVAFGAAIALVGAGVLLAGAGILVLSTALPAVSMYGASAAVGIAALGASMLLLGPGAIVASTALLALSVATVVVAVGVAALAVSAVMAGVGLLLLGAGALVAGAGLALCASGAPLVAASVMVIGPASILAGTGLILLGAGAMVASAGVMLLAGGATLAAGGVTLLAGGMAALAAAVTTVAAGLKTSASSLKTMGTAMPKVASGAPGAAAGLAAVAAAAVAAAPGLLAGTPALAAFAATCGTAAAVALVLAASIASVGANVRSSMSSAFSAVSGFGSKSTSAFRTFATSARTAASVARLAIMGACRQMSAQVGSLRLTLPRIQVGALPHFSMSGKFDAQSGSVPSVHVNWYASGGVFSSPSVSASARPATRPSSRSGRASCAVSARASARLGETHRRSSSGWTATSPRSSRGTPRSRSSATSTGTSGRWHMHRMHYVSSSGERVDLDGDGIFVGTAAGVRSREWSYELSWRGAYGISRDAREATVNAVLSSASADRLRRLSDRDMSLGEPGRIVVDGEWYQRAYIAKSETSQVYGRRGIAATLTVLLLDGSWRREVVQEFYAREDEDQTGLDFPHDFEFDYGGSAASRSVTVDGLVPADLKLTIFGPASSPRITVTQGDFINVYSADVEVPGGSRLVIDGSSFPKTIQLVGMYGEAEDRFADGMRGEGAGSGSYCFERLRPGTSSVSWDGSFGFSMTHYLEEGEPPWSS